jgi:hypothetical protein
MGRREPLQLGCALLLANSVAASARRGLQSLQIGQPAMGTHH